jgi:LacI family transcriptional regulator
MANAKVTLKEIADYVGCDISTVSKVLHGGRIRVRPATAQRIFEVAERLQYRPNAAARSLRSQRTLCLGIILPDLTNPVYSEIIRGALRKAEELGYVMLIAELGEAAQEDAFHRVVGEGRIDGLIVATASEQSSIGYLLARQTIPYVFVNRRPGGLGRSVIVDDDEGGALAARALESRGHRDVALIAGPDSIDTAVRRRRGFERTCRDLGLRSPIVESVEYTVSGGYQGMMRLLNSTPRPTGVFTSNLLVSIGALNAIHTSGLLIPRDISIVGVDDGNIAAFMWPPLTAVQMPFREMGEVVVEELDRIISGGEPQEVVVETPPVLVERATLGPPPLDASPDD